MRDYVREHTATLLRRLAYQVTQVRKNADADAVHDLRVAIRRLNRCLQVFAKFYPDRPRRKVRNKLREMMHEAAEVRDRDIAAALLREAGPASAATALIVLERDRVHAAARLSGVLGHWKQDSYSRRWRAELGL